MTKHVNIRALRATSFFMEATNVSLSVLAASAAEEMEEMEEAAEAAAFAAAFNVHRNAACDAAIERLLLETWFAEFSGITPENVLEAAETAACYDSWYYTSIYLYNLALPELERETEEGYWAWIAQKIEEEIENWKRSFN